MKIKASNANAANWRSENVNSTLPVELEKLNELAHNMWWSWNHECRDLFSSIDEDAWKACGKNPVLLLSHLSYEKMEAMTKDKALMGKMEAVYDKFRKYMDVKPDSKRPSVAYLCMEYGLNQVLKIYSGGLGVLAGDYL